MLKALKCLALLGHKFGRFKPRCIVKDGLSEIWEEATCQRCPKIKKRDAVTQWPPVSGSYKSGINSNVWECEACDHVAHQGDRTTGNCAYCLREVKKINAHWDDTVLRWVEYNPQ